MRTIQFHTFLLSVFRATPGPGGFPHDLLFGILYILPTGLYIYYMSYIVVFHSSFFSIKYFLSIDKREPINNVLKKHRFICYLEMSRIMNSQQHFIPENYLLYLLEKRTPIQFLRKFTTFISYEDQLNIEHRLQYLI